MTSREQLAQEICIGMRRLESLGLNHGTAGNLSVRCADDVLITPSGVKPQALQADAVVVLALADATPPAASRPSSEWRFHRDIYRARSDIHAVVHVHSAYATALACQGRDLPPFHYMIAVAGGADIRCAPYATFGTQALSDAAVAALAGRHACLLANHGLITTATDIDAAIDLAVEVEQLARQYMLSRIGGEPVLLGEDEMRDVIEKFKTYGARDGR